MQLEITFIRESSQIYQNLIDTRSVQLEQECATSVHSVGRWHPASCRRVNKLCCFKIFGSAHGGLRITLLTFKAGNLLRHPQDKLIGVNNPFLQSSEHKHLQWELKPHRLDVQGFSPLFPSFV
jgi:hypothetical protein